MTIIINGKSYEAESGERLIDVARINHAHIGYFCGGNGICQTCYVTVKKGSELLSPISDSEKALLSDTLIKEGTRMACLTTVEKPGTIEIVSTVEQVKEMFEKNPLQLPGYAGKMGWAALVKFPDTMQLQSTRSFDLWQLLSDIIGGIGSALQLVVDALQPACPAKAECKIIGHIDSANTDSQLIEATEPIAKQGAQA
ncbi:2Fe-2S iron-sulfur cluster-binding protein [Chlorobium sp. KB01]|uniref:2Fe-2S iron-sulfur cluster-binding protein n=1 Tax=Chlorobium sp. KB01 TaxID=1917528 RepID=UPI000975E663|nr:2Fe-2S iron-sulfur cluster-binding protein [Chlorobium sp. KB01]